MIEIFILIFLCKKIKALALEKGENGGKWIGIMIASWFGAEVIGIVIVFVVLGLEAMVPAIVVGLALAIGSFFCSKICLR